MAMTVTPDTPVIPPPPGTVSNFVDPRDFYHWTLGIGITGMVIMTAAVSIRTYTKARILREVGHEDYVAIAALLGYLAWSILYLYTAAAGITRDLWNIRAVDYPRLLYLNSIYEIIYGPAMLCAKYFVLIQLRKIFCPTGHRGAVSWALDFLIFASSSYYLATFFSFLFQCTPREKIWNPMLEGHCIDEIAGFLSAGIINFLLDLGILLVPTWAIWHLNMTFKRRLGAISVFTVGFVTVGWAAAGLAFRIPLIHAVDETRASARAGLWTLAEMTGTIIVGCMPTMPRFWEERLRPTVSHISQTSLRVLNPSQRSRRSQGLSQDLSYNLSRRGSSPVSRATVQGEEKSQTSTILAGEGFSHDGANNGVFGSETWTRVNAKGTHRDRFESA